MSELEYSKETNYGDFFTVINIVVMILFLIGLFIMARKHVSFPKRVFTALGWELCLV